MGDIQPDAEDQVGLNVLGRSALTPLLFLESWQPDGMFLCNLHIRTPFEPTVSAVARSNRRSFWSVHSA